MRTPSKHGWIITKTYGDADDAAAVGTIGPAHVSKEIEVALKEAHLNQKPIEVENYEFKLLDADGNLYYKGIYIGDQSESLFSPLDDFGAPNAGAIDIQILEKGVWESV